jgi:hypothetical protein
MTIILDSNSYYSRKLAAAFALFFRESRDPSLESAQIGMDRIGPGNLSRGLFRCKQLAARALVGKFL